MSPQQLSISLAPRGGPTVLCGVVFSALSLTKRCCCDRSGGWNDFEPFNKEVVGVLQLINKSVLKKVEHTRDPPTSPLNSVLLSRFLADSSGNRGSFQDGFGEADEEVLESFLGIVASIVKSSFVFEQLGKEAVRLTLPPRPVRLPLHTSHQPSQHQSPQDYISAHNSFRGRTQVSEAAAVFGQGPTHLNRRPSAVSSQVMRAQPHHRPKQCAVPTHEEGRETRDTRWASHSQLACVHSSWRHFGRWTVSESPMRRCALCTPPLPPPVTFDCGVQSAQKRFF